MLALLSRPLRTEGIPLLSAAFRQSLNTALSYDVTGIGVRPCKFIEASTVRKDTQILIYSNSSNLSSYIPFWPKIVAMQDTITLSQACNYMWALSFSYLPLNSLRYSVAGTNLYLTNDELATYPKFIFAPALMA